MWGDTDTEVPGTGLSLSLHAGACRREILPQLPPLIPPSTLVGVSSVLDGLTVIERETVSEVGRWWKPVLYSAASGIALRSDRGEAMVSADPLPSPSSSVAGAGTAERETAS